MAIADLFLRFKKQIETSDLQKDILLKTHYYNGSFDQLFQTVEKMIRQDADCQITTIMKEHGEIAAEVKKPFPSFLVVTVTASKPLKTAVDFTISTQKNSLSGMYPELRKRIISFYDLLNKKHSLMKQ